MTERVVTIEVEQWVIIRNCWFARDVTVAMLVVCWWSRTKNFSPLGIKPYFHVNSSRKNFFVIDHQHTTNMAALSHGCKPWIMNSSSNLLTCCFICLKKMTCSAARNKNDVTRDDL